MGVKIAFKEFVNTLHTVEKCVNKTLSENETYEYFLDLILKEGLDMEEVVTGDIAQVTLPITMVRRKQLYEVAPPDPEIEDWIINNKQNFKKRYGEDWKQVLYATAWKMFDQKKK